MATPSSQVPGYGTGTKVSGQGERNPRAGVSAAGTDPTNEPGQYPPGGWGAALFGGTLPGGTGAGGTSGGADQDSDPTTESGQLVDGLTGLSQHDITATGAPGSAGADPAGGGGGGEVITFTRTGSFGSGSYAQDTVNAATSGPKDWTQANMAGYATGGPKLPGMAEPQAGGGQFQPGGGGRVLRGGRDVRP